MKSLLPCFGIYNTDLNLPYRHPALFKALRMKAAVTEDSVSEIVNEACRKDLIEDSIDLKAFEERAEENLVSFEDVLKKLQSS
jgi:hypothetical protein